jgi:hypothetical protein
MFNKTRVVRNGSGQPQSYIRRRQREGRAVCLRMMQAYLGWFMFAVSAATLFSALVGNAQVITADLVGTVSDANGAVIPDARVTVINTDTQLQRVMNTTSTGDYVFTLLPPGTYIIQVEEKGFKTFEAKGVKIAAGDRTRVDAQLTAGAASETVTVMGDTIPVLQTDSSTVQDVVGEKAVQDLPLNGRNLQSAVQLTAGVNQGSPNAISGGARPDDRRPGFTFVANGQSDLSNDNLVDGLDNNEREQGFSGIHPSIDAIAEVRILTNNYSADLGRTAGAVVNIITKGGTNEFHGSAYEYLRNDIFDARDFFANPALRKAEYRQNIFGGSIGGPIVRNRTFFFADVEANRMIQGQVSTSTVPTLFEEQNPGNFSDIGGPVVPQSQISPVGLAYFRMYPAPTNSGVVNNYVSQPNKTQYSTSTDDRIDHRFSDRDSIFVRFGYNPVDTLVPGPLPPVKMGSSTVYPSGTAYAGPSNTTATNLQANYIHIVNPNLILELKAGFTRINIQTLPLNHGVDWASRLGMGNSYVTPDSIGLPYMWMLAGDYTSIGDGIFIPILDANNTLQYNGAVTYTKAGHNLKMGGALIRRQLNYFQDEFSPQGGFAFLPVGVYKNSLANLLSGNPVFAERGNDLAHQGLRSWEPSIYAQDDWRARSWLTLNLGVRWETFTPITDAHNQYANFNLQELKVQVAGKDTTSSGGVKTDYTDFSPRVGFAASLDRNTVLRGGFGFSYYPVIMQTQVENVNPPFSYVCFPCFDSSFPNLPTPSSSASNPVGTVSSEALDLKNAYVRQYNLFVQRQIAGNSFSLGGVGTQGRRALFLRNADLPLPPGAGNPTPPYVYAAQLPNVTSIQYIDNSGLSNYFALQAIFYRPAVHGLSFNANYTWAHGLANSVQASSSATNPSPALITNDPMYDYGNSPVDVRHRVAGALFYELPFGKSMQGFAGALAKNWQVTLMGFWQTGIPFTVVDANAAINLPGVTSDRPNQNRPAALSNPSIAKWFDTSAFSTQPRGTAGNEAPYSVYGPRARVLNASALKDFPLTERWRLQFRGEFFNLTNTPTFGQPGNGLTLPTFGVISSTAANMTPRQMQFALKLLF